MAVIETDTIRKRLRAVPEAPGCYLLRDAAGKVSRMAGSQHGVRLEPADLIAAAKRAGRTPAQRDTLYDIIETY